MSTGHRHRPATGRTRTRERQATPSSSSKLKKETLGGRDNIDTIMSLDIQNMYLTWGIGEETQCLTDMMKTELFNL